MDDPSVGRAEDLLDSIFHVATELVRGERASLMLREDASDDFVIAHALGLADDVKRAVRVRPGEGVAGHVVASKRSLLVRGGDARVAVRGRQYRSDSFMSVPIMIDDSARGVLNVTDRFDGGPFEETDLATLEIIAGHIGACLVQQEQGEALLRLAETDPLTWLFNRRHFDKRLEAETNRALRAEHLLALLMVDVDRFKLINDRFGHRVGDQVLKSVASALKQAVRLYDVPTRYGGDEFAVILPEADAAAAEAVATRITDELARNPLVADGRGPVPISVSIGVATVDPDVRTPTDLVGAADARMYRAKVGGGGRETGFDRIAEAVAVESA